MTAPALSAIVLLWNGAAYLERCVNSLLAQTQPDLEIILVDNASADGTAALARDRYPALTLVENEKNLGFAGGMNAGIRASLAPFVVLINQDSELDQTCLAEQLRTFQEDARIGAVGAKLLYADRLVLQHAGGFLRYPLALGHHYGYGEIDRGQHDARTDVEYVTGATMALRRSALDEVGLLDERFWPGYFEEVDLCLRLRQAGWRVVFQPNAVAVHTESASLGRNSDRYYAAYHRGRLRFVLKHWTDDEWKAFVAAEAERYPTLGLERERAVLTGVYRELAAEVLRGRPSVFPTYRRLLALEPSPRPMRLANFRRLFHPARTSDFDAALNPLRGSWSLAPPPPATHSRQLRRLIGGILRSVSWLVSQWSLLPIMEQQSRYNRQVLIMLERAREDQTHLLDSLVLLVASLDNLLVTLEERAEAGEQRADLLTTEVQQVRGIIGGLVKRAGSGGDAAMLGERLAMDEEIQAELDREMVQLRKALAMLTARTAQLGNVVPNGTSDEDVTSVQGPAT